MGHDESTIELRWVRWRVSGRVQGVGYRRFVQLAATRHALVGDVCNLPDGSVEIRARGTREELQRLRDDVGRGPRGARIDGVEALGPEASDSMTSFEIRADS
jgi:acylphosphatase